MNIVIRTDASIHLGSGHVMRCLTLADMLKLQSAKVVFVCREEKGNMIEFIENKGHDVHRLPADIDLAAERRLTGNFLEEKEEKTDWLIIDHYDIESSWESSQRKFVRKIMVIDDKADRKHNCDILLDQNFSLNGNRYETLTPRHALRLLGPEFALLRPQFLELRKKPDDRHDEVKRILVFMGGVDLYNQTYKALQAIQMLDMPDITTDVIIGESNPNRKQIDNLVSQMQNTSCYIQVKNMAELMVHADISIGAGGSTSWERCCLGLPTIVTILAENQRDISESLGRRGIVINLGWYEDVTASHITSALNELLDDFDKRKMMKLKSMEIVDGNGAKKVVEHLLRK